MQETTKKLEQTIRWETPEYIKRELGGDWYFVVWTIAVAGAVTCLLFNNILLGLILILGAASLSLLHNREPRMMAISVSNSGIRVNQQLYQYSNIGAFAIITNFNGTESRLLFEIKNGIQSLIVLTIPTVIDLEELRQLIKAHTPEEDLREPFTHRLTDQLGL